MCVRVVLMAAMAWGLLMAGVGQAADAAPRRTAMKGRTAQHYRVALRDHGRAVEIMRFTIKLACRDGSVLVDEESGFQTTSLGHGGRFHDDQIGSTDEVLFGGRLRGHLARGRIRVKDRLGNGVRCDSHWVRFSARARG